MDCAGGNVVVGTNCPLPRWPQLIELIKHENIRGVFLENISDPRLMAQIAQDTGVNVGGKLFTGALSEADGSAPTYLKMMEYNAKILVEGMK